MSKTGKTWMLAQLKTLQWASMLVGGITILLPCVSRAACTYVKNQAELMNGISKEFPLAVKKELRFLDVSQKEGRVVVRTYVNSRKLQDSDIVLYDASGKAARIALTHYPYTLEAKAVRIHPDRDSIFVAYSLGRCDGEALILIDPPSCETVEIYVNDGHDDCGYGFSRTAPEGINTTSPQFQKENAYLQRVKFDRGYVTPEMVAKDRGNPKWSEYVWMVDNEPPSSHLKLQWYPWDQKACSSNLPSFHHKQYEMFDKSPAVTICDTQKRQWATLFVRSGYHDWKCNLHIEGAQAIITRRYEEVRISLDNWEWSQQPLQ